MKEFHLQIVTPDGMFYDGNAQELLVRTTTGDVGILAGHSEYVAAVGIGAAKVVIDENKSRLAFCSGGLLTVGKEVTRLIPASFEWQENIDPARAQSAKESAEAILAREGEDPALLKAAADSKKRAEMRLKLAAKKS